MSNDIEDYMKSRVEEYEKIKNIVAPDQGTTTSINSDLSSNSNSNSIKVLPCNKRKLNWTF